MKTNPPTLSLRLKVLVVDDERIQRMRIAELVRQCACDVLEAASGEAAIALAAQQKVDIVLMDALMPGISGFDAAAAIKAQTSDRWLPIIFLSGLDEKTSRESWMDVGDDFLTKPVDAQLLKARLGSMRMAIAHDAHTRQMATELANEQTLARHMMERISFQHQADRFDWIQTREAAAADSSGDCIVAEGDQGNYSVLIADAMGHGLSAAITLIPAITVFRAMALKGFAPHRIAREINLKLRSMLPRERFISAAIVQVNRAQQSILVWNGGLPALMLLRQEGGAPLRFDSSAPPLGILDDGRFQSESSLAHWHDGDVLMMWTDGFTEAFGDDSVQLCQRLESNWQSRSALQLTQALWQDWTSHPSTDDASLVVAQLCAQGRQQAPLLAPSETQSPQVVARITLVPAQMKSGLGADSVLAAMAHLGLEALSADALVVVIVSELLANAVDHGLLGLDSALKKRGAEGFDEFYRLRSDRLMRLDHGQVDVEIRSTARPRTYDIDVKDTGKGFDIRGHADSAIAAIPESGGGRGLHLMRKLCERLVYLEGGTRAVATVCLSSAERQ